jgi:hypothetical protein
VLLAGEHAHATLHLTAARPDQGLPDRNVSLDLDRIRAAADGATQIWQSPISEEPSARKPGLRLLVGFASRSAPRPMINF